MELSEYVGVFAYLLLSTAGWHYQFGEETSETVHRNCLKAHQVQQALAYSACGLQCLWPLATVIAAEICYAQHEF